MQISKIIVRNFRSLKCADINPDGFNILIGQNNHGKTNLFEAVKWFYSIQKTPIKEIRYTDAKDDEELSVEIHFSGVQEGLADISHAANRAKLEGILGEEDIMCIKRTSSDPKNRYLYNPADGKWEKQPCGADSTFNNCIPRFEFIGATKNLKEVAAYKNTTPIGQMLSGVLAESLEQDDKYQNFQKAFEELFQAADSPVRKKLKELGTTVQSHLSQQFPDCTEVHFDVEEPSFDDLLKNYRTQLDDGVKTTAEEKGDGMQRALMLAIIKTHADFRRSEALGRSFIFFIDEAELHLHPTGQRQLKNALLELSDYENQGVDQVFMSTHSSVFIADGSDQQQIFEVNKDERSTDIIPIDQKERQHVVYQLLGGSPADLLLPANFMIVEGPSEVKLINGLIRRFYASEAQIHIIAAESDDEAQRQSMNAIIKVFDPLTAREIYKNKLIILCDQPDENKLTRFDRFKAENSHLEENAQLFVLEVNGLEDYYPVELKKRCPHSSPRKKTIIAEWMSCNITQEAFEKDMPIIFNALNACWSKAYQ